MQPELQATRQCVTQNNRVYESTARILASQCTKLECRPQLRQRTPRALRTHHSRRHQDTEPAPSDRQRRQLARRSVATPRAPPTPRASAGYVAATPLRGDKTELNVLVFPKGEGEAASNWEAARRRRRPAPFVLFEKIEPGSADFGPSTLDPTERCPRLR